MGICQSGEKLNGIIDNQSSYEIIYHVSGTTKQSSDYQEELNLGAKLDVGLDKVRINGANYNKKWFSKNEKYHSVARIPKKSFCSVGLNDIEAGCFLSIYAVKLNEKGKQVYKKLIFKDICIRTNDDICLRINKDLTLKQLNPLQITNMKQYIQKAGSVIVSRIEQTPNILKSQLPSPNVPNVQQQNRLKEGSEYVRKKFGKNGSERYTKYQPTGLFDLDHKEVKINMEDFIKHDWAYLQSLQLDSCGVDDNGWYLLSFSAEYNFPNLKNLYLADNKITSIVEGDLEKFPSLKVLELDYGQTEGLNPLTDDSKKYLLAFALINPQIAIFCASIDENKYMKAIKQTLEALDKQDHQNQGKFEYPFDENTNMGWFILLPPDTNETRPESEEIRKSKNVGKKKKINKQKPKVIKNEQPKIIAVPKLEDQNVSQWS